MGEVKAAIIKKNIPLLYKKKIKQQPLTLHHHVMSLHFPLSIKVPYGCDGIMLVQSVDVDNACLKRANLYQTR